MSRWIEKASKGSHGLLFMGQAWRWHASPLLTLHRLEHGPMATSNNRKDGEGSLAGHPGRRGECRSWCSLPVTMPRISQLTMGESVLRLRSPDSSAVLALLIFYFEVLSFTNRALFLGPCSRSRSPYIYKNMMIMTIIYSYLSYYT